MAIDIRKGTTKSLIFTIDCDNKEWTDLGTVHVRLKQGSLVIDKIPTILASDPTSAQVDYTQEETIRLIEGQKAELQIFPVIGPEESEIAVKSDVYEVNVLRSLWNEVVHNG